MNLESMKEESHEELAQLEWLLRVADRRAKGAFDNASRTMSPNAYAEFERSVGYVQALKDLRKLLKEGDKPSWAEGWYPGRTW